MPNQNRTRRADKKYYVNLEKKHQEVRNLKHLTSVFNWVSTSVIKQSPSINSGQGGNLWQS